MELHGLYKAPCSVRNDVAVRAVENVTGTAPKEVSLEASAEDRVQT